MLAQIIMFKDFSHTLISESESNKAFICSWEKDEINNAFKQDIWKYTPKQFKDDGKLSQCMII